MILFQKNALSLNNESNYCVMLVEMLRGACEAVKLSQPTIILGKASRRIPRYLSTTTVSSVATKIGTALPYHMLQV